MKYKNKIIIILAIFFIPIISETNALYVDKINKSTELYIAKPICRVILDKEILISNYIQKMLFHGLLLIAMYHHLLYLPQLYIEHCFHILMVSVLKYLL